MRQSSLGSGRIYNDRGIDCGSQPFLSSAESIILTLLHIECASMAHLASRKRTKGRFT